MHDSYVYTECVELHRFVSRQFGNHTAIRWSLLLSLVGIGLIFYLFCVLFSPAGLQAHQTEFNQLLSDIWK